MCTENKPPIYNIHSNLSCGWNKGLAWILMALTGITVFFRFMLPIRDGDIWFHLAYAEYFLENMTLIPDHSIYSWTPAVNTEYYCAWLSEIVLYGLYKFGGVAALISFRYFCVCVFLYIVVRYARKLDMIWHPLTWFIALISVLMSYVAIYAKPEIFSWIFFTLLAWNWWHIRSAGAESWKNNYLFPLIMVVWVNSHGSFVFGLVFLLLIGVGEIINGLFFPGQVLLTNVRKHLFISIGLSFLIVIINPYGIDYPLQLIETLNPSAERVGSLSHIAAFTQPLSGESKTLLFAYYINLAVLLFVVLVVKNFKTGKLEASAIVTTLCFVFLYTQFWRTTFYFAPVFFFSSLPLIPKGRTASPSRQILSERILGLLIVGVALVISAATLHEGYVKPEKHLWMGFGVNEDTPVEEVEFVSQYYPAAQVGNTYGVGSYLLWKRWPNKKVFIDARFFPYKNWIDQYWDFRDGKNVTKMLEQNPSDLWVVEIVSDQTLLHWFVRSPDWRLVFYGKVAAVFCRTTFQNNEMFFHGESIYTLKSPLATISLFTFACYIGDFPVVEQIINNSRNSVGISPSLVKGMTQYYKGLRTFLDGNFVESIEPLTTAKTAVSDDTLLISAYVLAIDSLWQEGKLEEADKYAQKSYLFAPASLANRYNLAVINWYLEQQGLKDIGQTLNWREELKQVLSKLVADIGSNQGFRIIVEDILNGSYNAKPPIISFQKHLTHNESKLFEGRSGGRRAADN